MRLRNIALNTVLGTAAVVGTLGVPANFPRSGNGLWFSNVGKVWSLDYLPVGNGYLAAMTPGGTVQESMQLNIESLWSGGPFQDPTYNGGNKQADQLQEMASAMQQYRSAIFASKTGDIANITTLTTDAGAYGSYVGAGYLVSTLDLSGNQTNVVRWLDLDQGIARNTWTQSGAGFTRETFCSHPTESCTHHISSTGKHLPLTTFAFSSALESGLPTPNITCLDSHTLRVRGTAGEPGMLYEILGQVMSSGGTVACSASSSPANATISVTGASEAWITWVGGTEYDQNAGDKAHGFSFQGPDPHSALVQLISKLPTSYSSLRAAHFADFDGVLNKFSLSLGSVGSEWKSKSTDQIVASYQVDQGDIYLEWLMFNFGRYLLGSSARGVLPANLQGKWALSTGNPWSADYHSNINIQMNYWSAEMTNLDVSGPLFDYFEKNWAPRGAETAQVLYNISRGWVTHNEMNIFGHTGMKADSSVNAMWANYPESSVWMMLHVFDHFDYTNDLAWLRTQGYPLLKSVASFQLDKLIPDLRFNDGTLVVAPCNSPEQAPITLGCAHAQQIVWQLFNAIEKSWPYAGDNDTAFLAEVQAKRAQMDKGLHVGSWGQLQEWKVDQDAPNDTHRHLSHLIGLYPGYAISNYDGQGLYSREQILSAAETSLIHRGNGTGPDADAGWAKMWRAAAWAQLGDPAKFYHQLTYGIYENFGPNLFSLYDPADADPIFQIDANLGLPGAVLNAIIQAPDVPTRDTPLKITLLPALPQQWHTGSIKGARIRGGLGLDFEWEGGQPKRVNISLDAQIIPRPVQVWHANKLVAQFETSGGMHMTITRFT